MSPRRLCPRPLPRLVEAVRTSRRKRRRARATMRYCLRRRLPHLRQAHRSRASSRARRVSPNLRPLVPSRRARRQRARAWTHHRTSDRAPSTASAGCVDDPAPNPRHRPVCDTPGLSLSYRRTNAARQRRDARACARIPQEESAVHAIAQHVWQRERHTDGRVHRPGGALRALGALPPVHGPAPLQEPARPTARQRRGTQVPHGQ